MLFRELCEKNNFNIVTEESTAEKEIKGCYIGDLLSWVMSRCCEGDVWITVMNNVNIIAVASMSDAAGIILAEDAAISDDVIAKANAQNVCIAKCPRTAYEVSKIIAPLLS